MSRNAMLALAVGACLGVGGAALGPVELSPPKRRSRPVLEPKPLPPSTMTRQQRRAAEREERKDARRWEPKRKGAR